MFFREQARSFRRLKDSTSKYIKESVDIWSEVLRTVKWFWKSELRVIERRVKNSFLCITAWSFICEDDAVGLALISVSVVAALIQNCPENIILKPFASNYRLPVAPSSQYLQIDLISVHLRMNGKAQTEASSGNITCNVFSLQT